MFQTPPGVGPVTGALDRPKTRGGGGEGVQDTQHIYPPRCPNTGQVLVQVAKARKHGIPVFGQARNHTLDAPKPAGPDSSAISQYKAVV